MEVRWLGRISYPDAHALSQALVAQRAAGEIGDTCLLLEHDHVFTRGRKTKGYGNILDAGGVPVVDVERGGDVTYHGPGQLVAYPIVMLPDGQRDAVKFIRRLEGWVIDAMADLGVDDGTRRDGFSGVWCKDKKVASVGVAITAKWVTWHGIALNVCPDLSYFGRLNPCGLEAQIMSSLCALTGLALTVDDARAALVDRLPGL